MNGFGLHGWEGRASKIIIISFLQKKVVIALTTYKKDQKREILLGQQLASINDKSKII